MMNTLNDFFSVSNFSRIILSLEAEKDQPFFFLENIHGSSEEKSTEKDLG